MILTVLLNFTVNCFCGLLNGLKILSLPVDMISALFTIIKYGNYIVGTDLMLIIFGSIMGWLTIRTTVGVVLFIWRLLPLT